jgi:hypothetical protein
MNAIGLRTARRAAAAGLLFSLATVSAAGQRAPTLVAMNIVAPYVEDEPAFARLSDRPPANITIPDTLRDTMAAMLRDSVTFRRQCQRIARSPHLEVVVHRTLLPASSEGGAFTRVTRRPDGAVEATVRIGMLGDDVTLLAHEFEHIIEQLDGVDLAAMASQPDTGVYFHAVSGQYETERAAAAGRRAAREVDDAGGR